MNLLLKNQLICSNLCKLTQIKSINRHLNGFKVQTICLNTCKQLLLNENNSQNVRQNRDYLQTIDYKLNTINNNNNSIVGYCSRRGITTTPHRKAIENYSPYDTFDGLVYRVRRYWGYTTIPKYRLRNTSIYLYESCTDGLNIENYFHHLKLPDTFLSWFLVTQLHVWLCMVRAMYEGREGRVMRNELVARMWEDCETRLKKMAVMTAKVKRKGMEDLLEQFQAAIFSYDEGILSDDKTLAAALWRTLYTFECDDPIPIETMVSYVRTQLEHLHTIGTEKFLLDGKIVWKHFSPLYP